MRITWIGSISQLHLDSSISELRYLASRTNCFNDSPFAKMITWLTNVLLFGCISAFTAKMISFCSNTSSNRLICLAIELGLYLLVVFRKMHQILEVNVMVNLLFQHQIRYCVRFWVF